MDIGALKVSPDEDNEEVRAAPFPIGAVPGSVAVWEAPSVHRRFTSLPSLVLEKLHTGVRSA